MLRWFVIVVAVAASSAGTATIPAKITAAVADPARAAAQVATDATREPAATTAFAGVAPGMMVGDFFPGGGYYTRMLADVVGPRGRVDGIENAGCKDALTADNALIATGLSNVIIAVLPFVTVAFPAPLDLVWVTQIYHDLKIAEYGVVDTAVFNRAVFAALKPGGFLFILDHEASPATGTAAIATLHRIKKAQVIREVTAAGFRLVTEGDFLRDASDDHSVPIFDKTVQGHTDQYALKFVEPR